MYASGKQNSGVLQPTQHYARQVLTLTLSSRCPRRPRHSSMVYTFSTFQACREFQPLLGLRRVGAKLVLCRHTSHGVTFGVRCGAVHANPKLHICPRHAWECDPARRDVLGSTRVGVGGKVIQAFSGLPRRTARLAKQPCRPLPSTEVARDRKFCWTLHTWYLCALNDVC